MSEMKRCNKCGQEKPADTAHFTVDRRLSSGLGPYCKPCQALYKVASRNKERGGPPRPRITAGEKYGRLLAIGRAPDQGGKIFWRFKCDCGTECEARTGHVRAGKTQSCGCLAKDTIAIVKTTHGWSGTPEYRSWCGMIKRCEDQKSNRYQHYGARGIKVCERWRGSFEAFLSDMGPRPSPQHTIDRRDNDKNYEPGNVRWATRIQQMRNRTNTIFVEWSGRRMPLIEACEIEGVDYGTAKQRLYKGWAIEKVLLEQAA